MIRHITGNMPFTVTLEDFLVADTVAVVNDVSLDVAVAVVVVDSSPTRPTGVLCTGQCIPTAPSGTQLPGSPHSTYTPFKLLASI